MGHWGWRSASIVICICVWIVGCTDQHAVAPASTPTVVAQITLMFRTPQHFAADDDPALPAIITPRPDDADHFEAAVAVSSLFPAATPFPLIVSNPTCYESTPGGVVCLGLVHNPHDFPVSRVTLLAYLYGLDGEILRDAVVTLDQRFIPPGESAPYRLLFPPGEMLYLSEAFGGIQTAPLSAMPATGMNAYAGLEAEVLDADWQSASYILTMRLTNRENVELSGARLVATLTDTQGRVTGYRVVETLGLQAGDTVTLTIPIDTHITGEPLTVTLHVETLP